MRACMPCSGSMHVHTARTTARYSRCNVHRAARCSVYRSQRAAQGYHYGGSRHSLLIAGFQRESRPNERTNERTNARSSVRSPSLYFPRRERTRTRATNAPRNTHTRDPPPVEYRALFSTWGACRSMGESGHRPVEFLPPSLNISPASIRYFVTDTLTRESVPVGGTGLSRLRGKLDWAEERVSYVLPEKNRSVSFFFCCWPDD